MKPSEIIAESKKLMEQKEPKFWLVIEMLDSLEIKDNSKSSDAAIEKNVIIAGNVFLEKGAVLKSGTCIEGNAYIGKGSIIGPNAYLRGNVVIADNCKVSNSEIKNSILLSGAKVPHFSYVGDSILGEHVNLGAGAKIANLRMDNATVKVDFFGRRIDSKKRKLGALIKDGASIGINACINCGTIIGKNAVVFPGAFARRSVKDNATIER